MSPAIWAICFVLNQHRSRPNKTYAGQKKSQILSSWTKPPFEAPPEQSGRYHATSATNHGRVTCYDAVRWTVHSLKLHLFCYYSRVFLVPIVCDHSRGDNNPPSERRRRRARYFCPAVRGLFRGVRRGTDRGEVSESRHLAHFIA
jgi:hypothetical protein